MDGVEMPLAANVLYREFNSNNRPKIITLCGSVRFTHAYQLQQLQLSLRGWIVLTVGIDVKKADAFLGMTEDDKKRLDELHLRKIDLSDAIMVLNVDGYVGQSTEDEIVYALQHEKRIDWLEPYVAVRKDLEGNDLPPGEAKNVTTLTFMQMLCQENEIMEMKDRVG